MFTDEQFADALNQMHVASKTLDFRDAVHIQLWLAVRGIQDHAFIGAQIAEAHEKALALASGELERLRAANEKMKSALVYYADDGARPNPDGPWKQNSIDFGDLARCTLADVAALQGDAP